jgi:hypothetical protein
MCLHLHLVLCLVVGKVYRGVGQGWVIDDDDDKAVTAFGRKQGEDHPLVDENNQVSQEQEQSCTRCSGGTTGQCQEKVSKECNEPMMGHCYFGTQDCGRNISSLQDFEYRDRDADLIDSLNYSTPWLTNPEKFQAFSAKVRQQSDFSDMRYYFDCEQAAASCPPRDEISDFSAHFPLIFQAPA